MTDTDISLSPPLPRSIQIVEDFLVYCFVKQEVAQALALTETDIAVTGLDAVAISDATALESYLTGLLPGLPQAEQAFFSVAHTKTLGSHYIHMTGEAYVQWAGQEQSIFQISAVCTYQDTDCRISSLHFTASLDNGLADILAPFQQLPVFPPSRSLQQQRADTSACFMPSLLMDCYSVMVDGFAIFSDDAPPRLLDGDQGFYSLLGYTQEEFSTMETGLLDSLLHPTEHRRFLQVRESLREEGKGFSRLIRLRRKDHSWVWVRLGMLFMPDTNKGKPGYYCFFSNINALRRRDKSFEWQGCFLNLLASEIDMGGVIVRDEPNYPIVHVGESLPRFLGYSSMTDMQKARLTHGRQLLHKDDWKDLALGFDRQLRKTGHLEGEFRIRKKDGTYRWVMAKGRRMIDDEGQSLIIFLWTDISQHKILEQELRHKAQLDSHTNVRNRASAARAIEYELQAARHGEKTGFFIIDLDDFKQINDNYGHMAGDEVLLELVALLQANTRQDDIIGRLGGDEFMIFMKNIHDISILEQKANAICRGVEKTFANRFPGKTVSVSIGIALASTPNSFNTLYSTADKAMYHSKDKGKNTWNLISLLS